MKSGWLILAAAILAGCQHGGTTPDGGNPFVPAEGGVRRAVVAGLTAVDPAAYGGWSGACPGCDVDADLFGLLCVEQGLQVKILHNAQATRAGLERSLREACEGLAAGDLLVLYVSGHGGQVDDGDTTETDGLSETLCLWDGEMTDTYLAGLLARIPAGVRLFFVTDTCNSGTNYRRRRRLDKAVPAAFRAGLIHFGGCADGFSSYGSAQGGVFTTALIDAWREGIGYQAWFRAAAGLMPAHQVAVYTEHGDVTEAFRKGRALQ
jgi:hypothetical protein